MLPSLENQNVEIDPITSVQFPVLNLSPFVRAALERGVAGNQSANDLLVAKRATAQGIPLDEIERRMAELSQDVSTAQDRVSTRLGRMDSLGSRFPAAPDLRMPRATDAELGVGILAALTGGPFGASLATAPHRAAANRAQLENQAELWRYRRDASAFGAELDTERLGLAADQFGLDRALRREQEEARERRLTVLDQIRMLSGQRDDVARQMSQTLRAYDDAIDLETMRRYGNQLGFDPDSVERDYASRRFERASSWSEALSLGKTLGFTESQVRARFGDRFQTAQDSGTSRDSARSTAQSGESSVWADLARENRRLEVEQSMDEALREFKTSNRRDPSAEEREWLGWKVRLTTQERRLRIAEYRRKQSGSMSRAEAELVRAEVAELDRIRANIRRILSTRPKSQAILGR